MAYRGTLWKVGRSRLPGTGWRSLRRRFIARISRDEREDTRRSSAIHFLPPAIGGRFLPRFIPARRFLLELPPAFPPEGALCRRGGEAASCGLEASGYLRRRREGACAGFAAATVTIGEASMCASSRSAGGGRCSSGPSTHPPGHLAPSADLGARRVAVIGGRGMREGAHLRLAATRCCSAYPAGEWRCVDRGPGMPSFLPRFGSVGAIGSIDNGAWPVAHQGGRSRRRAPKSSSAASCRHYLVRARYKAPGWSWRAASGSRWRVWSALPGASRSWSPCTSRASRLAAWSKLRGLSRARPGIELMRAFAIARQLEEAAS